MKRSETELLDSSGSIFSKKLDSITSYDKSRGMKNIKKGDFVKLNVSGDRKLILQNGYLAVTAGDVVRVETLPNTDITCPITGRENIKTNTGESFIVSETVDRQGGGQTLNKFFVQAGEICK